MEIGKTIRFGQQGAKTKPPRSGESAADKAKRKSFKARHAKYCKRKDECRILG